MVQENVAQKNPGSTYPLYDLLPERKRSSDILFPSDAAKTPGYPTIKITGFFQADAAWFNQDSNSIATYGNIQDNRGFRRTRLAAIGDVAENVSYMLEMDFAFPGRPSFMDVWLDLHKIPFFGNVRVGQYRMPFGMDELTSVRELPFIERSITFGMTPFRQLGVGFHNNNESETVTWSFAGFGFPTDFFGNSVGDRGYGLAGRITSLLWLDEADNRLLHVGGDYSYLNTSTGTFRFRNQPEYGGQFTPFNLGNTGTTTVPFFVDSGFLRADTSHLANLEVASSSGSFYTQSELRYAFVNLTNGKTVTIPMLYTEAGYFLTGEQRGYNRKSAVFSRVKPLQDFGNGGLGAWEIAGRYSYANMNDFANNVFGNELSNTTLGVNWYLNQYTKFQFNWIHSFVNTGTGLYASSDIYAIRAQLDF